MPRQISVALLPTWLESSRETSAFTAVVIDALRFTSTACQALHAGASAITVSASVDEAQRLAESRDPRPLLCGERHCRPIAGFDLGNSPYEFIAEKVQGKELIFTTTNGTRAVAAANRATSVALAALVNLDAVCRWLLGTSDSRVTLVCAGTDGEVALEDVLVAGAILHRLLPETERTSPAFECANDAALLALASWRELASSANAAHPLETLITDRISQAAGGRNLVQTGYARDIRFAAQLDTIDLVPLSTVEKGSGLFYRKES